MKSIIQTFRDFGNVTTTASKVEYEARKEGKYTVESAYTNTKIGDYIFKNLKVIKVEEENSSLGEYEYEIYDKHSVTLTITYDEWSAVIKTDD